MPYLTKSRFKLALECPTKLHYYRNPEYKDKREDDTFLRSLAWGGFQVGALAKLYYPGGIEIYTRKNTEALAETQTLMQQENGILYGPAFAFENLLIRVDVLVKEGKNIKLIEVKSKSYDDSDEFLTKKSEISADWKSYLYDVAFQKHVLTHALPDHNISAYLMLVDKSTVATVEKLNQRFFIKAGDIRNVEILTKDTDNLGAPILTAENVDDIIKMIWNGPEVLQGEILSFANYVRRLSEYCDKEHPIWQGVSRECKTCQFRLSSPVEEGLKSGFHQCWQRMANLSEADFDRPLVLDIWDYRKTDEKLSEGKYFQDQLDPEELDDNKPNPKPGLSRIDRQELQILKSRESDPDIFLDIDGLQYEFEQLSYPLNFIDFETSLVPIPFYQGQRPYEIIAFQFSHHTMDEVGLTGCG